MMRCVTFRSATLLPSSFRRALSSRCYRRCHHNISMPTLGCSQNDISTGSSFGASPTSSASASAMWQRGDENVPPHGALCSCFGAEVVTQMRFYRVSQPSAIGRRSVVQQTKKKAVKRGRGQPKKRHTVTATKKTAPRKIRRTGPSSSAPGRRKKAKDRKKQKNTLVMKSFTLPDPSCPITDPSEIERRILSLPLRRFKALILGEMGPPFTALELMLPAKRPEKGKGAAAKKTKGSKNKSALLEEDDNNNEIDFDVEVTQRGKGGRSAVTVIQVSGKHDANLMGSLMSALLTSRSDGDAGDDDADRRKFPRPRSLTKAGGRNWSSSGKKEVTNEALAPQPELRDKLGNKEKAEVSNERNNKEPIFGESVGTANDLLLQHGDDDDDDDDDDEDYYDEEEEEEDMRQLLAREVAIEKLPTHLRNFVKKQEQYEMEQRIRRETECTLHCACCGTYVCSMRDVFAHSYGWPTFAKVNTSETVLQSCAKPLEEQAPELIKDSLASATAEAQKHHQTSCDNSTGEAAALELKRQQQYQHLPLDLTKAILSNKQLQCPPTASQLHCDNCTSFLGLAVLGEKLVHREGAKSTNQRYIINPNSVFGSIIAPITL